MIPSNFNEFPDDENGHVLRRMAEDGDDLSRSREVDFVAVVPTAEAARSLEAMFTSQGYRVRVDEACTVEGLPWDVVIVKEMIPSHAAISSFEGQVESAAQSFGGRADGWGCFEQSAHH